MKAFKLLFSPIRIGTMEVRNRIVMSPMGTNFAAPDGSCTERLINYHEARAAGGVGLIIVEITTPDPSGKPIPLGTTIHDDKQIPGWRELVKAVHAHGAKVAMQLGHAGRESLSMFTGAPLVAPSPIPSRMYQEMPKELTVEEIEDLVEKFGEAARRAREAGFDGVELHSAHGYLISAFMSPYSNKRSDEYGGNLEGRLKFPMEIIKSIRRKVGSDYPLIFRLSAEEAVESGRKLVESKFMATLLAEAGVDALHVSVGCYRDSVIGSATSSIAAMGTPPAVLAPAAKEIKAVVDVPVIVANRINDPRVAELVLLEGAADLTAMGRALIADPDLPRKAAAGDFDDIRMCLGCNEGCIDKLFSLDLYVTCVVNPTVGKEKEMAITRVEKPKKVLVAGGGPGGLEAARVAALRGHEVTLFEKADRLGGQLNIASIAPFKQEMTLLTKWLSSQTKKVGVKVQLGKEVTPAVVKELNPDVVIIATGAVPLVPDMPGVSKDRVVTAWDVLSSKTTVGNKVVVLGGGMVGCEVAEHLADLGRQVTIVEMLDDVALDVGIVRRPPLLWRLTEYGVGIVTSATVKEITDDGVVFTKDGREETLDGMDNMVLAVGAKSFNGLGDKIKDKVGEVYVIGDAKEPRKALEAMAEGADIARKI